MFKVMFYIMILAVIFLVYFSLSFNDSTTEIITVNRLERVGDNGGEYLIFTYKDGIPYMVFENTDNMFRGKWNSSDFYNRLQVGKKYKFVVIGYRVPFLSMYKNIIKIEEIQE